jgi:hypothetical protein
MREHKLVGVATIASHERSLNTYSLRLKAKERRPWLDSAAYIFFDHVYLDYSKRNPDKAR